MRTLIVGGPTNYVQNSLISPLRDLGLETQWHFTTGEQGIPTDCEVVLVLKETGISKNYKAEAEQRGIKHVEISRHMNLARQTLEKSGILTQLPVKSKARRVRNRAITSQQKQEAATEFILDRLRKGIQRTNRDMLRAHIKSLFGSGVGINDVTVRNARAAAAGTFEQEQQNAEESLDQTVRDGIQMVLDDYPESSAKAVEQFLVALYEVDNVEAFLALHKISSVALENLIQKVRVELFTEWSKPQQERSDAEQAAFVQKQQDFVYRFCMACLKEKGGLPTWDTISTHCRRVFGGTLPVSDLQDARKKAKAEFIPSKPKTEVTVSAVTPWFRRTRPNYTPARVEAQLTTGIAKYQDLNPATTALIVSWMESILSKAKGSMGAQASRAIRKVFNKQPPLVVNTIMYLCWAFLRENVPLAPAQYRLIYSSLTGKTMGHYAPLIVLRYVTPEGEFAEPVQAIYKDSPAEAKPVKAKPVETKPVETKPVETKPVETKPVETKPVETPIMAPLPATLFPEMLGKLDQIISAQQATAAQFITAQQAQADKVLAEIRATQTQLSRETGKVRGAIESLGSIIQNQNEALVAILDTLKVIDDRVERLEEAPKGNEAYLKGLVTTIEGLKGSVGLLVEKAETPSGPIQAGFNPETQHVVSDLLACLQQLNAANLVHRLDSLEERVITAAVTAAAETTSSQQDLTIRDIIELGGQVSIGGPLPFPTESSLSEYDSLKQTLEQCGGNRTATARTLGIPRSSLLYKLKKHNLG